MCTEYDFLGAKPALPSVENCILIKKYNKSSTYMRNMMQIHVNLQLSPDCRGIGLDLQRIDGAQVSFCRSRQMIRPRAYYVNLAPLFCQYGLTCRSVVGADAGIEAVLRQFIYASRAHRAHPLRC
jgi:hypothetical protein